VSDTQWPRFYVFKQDVPDGPHLNCGSIHAPDIELALLNARDVFVRRPACVSLWVVPAEAIHRNPPAGEAEDQPQPPDTAEPFVVFLKADHRQPHQSAGEVEAVSAEQALALAEAERSGERWVELWVAPAASMLGSDPADQAAWFAPADDKPYRHGSFYHTETAMRQLMAGGSIDES